MWPSKHQLPLVKIAADCAVNIICPKKNGSNAQYVKYGLTDSVPICENDIHFILAPIFLQVQIIFYIYILFRFKNA